MRISDWSSDVCSSDLAGTQRLSYRKPVRDQVQRHWVPACAGMTAWGIAGAAWSPNHRRSCHSTATSPSTSRHRSCSPTPAAAVASCRSEEHTSELQSLMRISYAVFCLKKILNYVKQYDTRRQLQNNEDVANTH